VPFHLAPTFLLYHLSSGNTYNSTKFIQELNFTA
jgi:hypothetical protein